MLGQVKLILNDKNVTEMERCEQIKKLVNQTDIGGDLKDKFTKEYKIIVDLFDLTEFTDKLAKFILDGYIRNGNWHLFTRDAFMRLVSKTNEFYQPRKSSDILSITAKYDSLKEKISEIHGVPTESFVKQLSEIHKCKFDLSDTFYLTGETPIVVRCNKCKKEYNVKPNKALNPKFRCFGCYVVKNYTLLRNGRDESSSSYAKIVDRLYLGDINSILDEKFLAGCKIKATIDLSGSTNTPRTVRSFGLDHYKINIDDNAHANIDKYFEKIIDFIDKHVSAQPPRNVLVFCRAGVSRSATSVIAYLMDKCQATYDEVYTYVKQRRNKVQPNRGFTEKLRVFEN